MKDDPRLVRKQLLLNALWWRQTTGEIPDQLQQLIYLCAEDEAGRKAISRRFNDDPNATEKVERVIERESLRAFGIPVEID